jgi:hypothetical protein
MRAVADAARFDRSAVAPWAGAVTALPVAAVLAAGLLSPDPSAGVLMAVGAMLVGISSRARGNRPRLGTMASAMAMMGLSTFVGSATGHIAGLHLGLLTLWSFLGALMIVVAPERSIIGTLAIIAFIVFGRFTAPVDGAARLAGFVVAGGAAQVIVAFLVRWPHRTADERRLSGLHPLEQLRSAAAEVGANLTLRSTPCRHAVRLAVLVPATTALAEYSGLHRGYWVPLTVVLVLRPDFASTSSQGAARVLGTFLGLALAGVVAVSLHPSGAWSVVAVAATSWAAYATFRASPVAWVGFITALVVFLLNVVTPDTAGVVVDRLVDSLIGGAVALGAYLLWPTWSERDAERSLAQLAEVERSYAGSILAAASGKASPSLGYSARQTRIAAANAEAAVTRSLAEPKVHRIDADRGLGVLEGFRRVSESLHALRTDLRGRSAQVPEPEAGELAVAVDTTMASIAAALGNGGSVGQDPRLALVRGRLALDIDDRATVVRTDQLLGALGALVHILRDDPAPAASP